MPTALELKREEWEPYIGAAARRPVAVALMPAEQKERERLLAQVHEAAKTLKQRFAVRRVILFGSLAHGGWFIPDSDVDLAVDGLAVTDFWAAWRVAEEIIGDRPVDFIEWNFG
jgi:predicted nucleotidyltransferase